MTAERNLTQLREMDDVEQDAPLNGEAPVWNAAQQKFLYGTAGGAPGPQGPAGPTGPAGIAVDNYRFTYSSVTTSGDPGAGKFRFDQAVGTPPTVIRISETDLDGTSVAQWLSKWAVSSSATKANVTIRKRTDPSVWIAFGISSQSDQGAYRNNNISGVTSNGSFVDGDEFLISFTRVGDAGTAGQGVPVGGTSGQVLTKNSATNYDTGWASPSGGGGSTWYFGTGAPSAGLGVVGDVYLDDDANEIYTKDALGWGATANLNPAIGVSQWEYVLNAQMPSEGRSTDLAYTNRVQADPYVLGGYIANWNTGGAIGSYIEWRRFLSAGTWQFNYHGALWSDAGIITIKIDGTAVGTIDTYNSGNVAGGWVTLDGVTIADDGLYMIRAEVTGKNAASAAPYLYIAFIQARRTA
jgi:hypothetical protein